jgi:zinc protease
VKRLASRSVALLLASLLVACAGQAPPPRTPPPPPPRPALLPMPIAPVAPADPLGDRPGLPPPAAFTPPVPLVYTRADGVSVWLLERHALPIVSVEMVLPAGASGDPSGKEGLAYATATMLDEGAAGRGALDIARDVDRLGATLRTGAYADYAFVQLTTLKKNFAPAAEIFGDVVVRPTFPATEWKRVHDLWANDLIQRQSDPSAVASVVMLKKVFDGTGSAYGHATEGTTRSAARVDLGAVKKFYGEEWLPARATCVVVGDVTRAELDPILDKALAGWKHGPPGAAAGSVRGGTKPKESGRRVVVVDRPDAPQSVIAVARQGVAASSPDAPLLVRVNAALGGSFTSRLNQDLREEHGWSYGARSRFSFTAHTGFFVAQAAVHTEHTGDALAAMLADVEGYAKDGPNDEEVGKTRLLARADLVESFESVSAAAHRLSRNAGVGLAADHEAKASAVLYAATKDDLRRLAARYVDPRGAVIVIVGPRAKIEPQLHKIGIDKLEASGPEGE